MDMNGTNYTHLRPVGIGINYQAKFIELLDTHKSLIDFVEVSPDTLCHSKTCIHNSHATPQLVLNPKALNLCLDTIADYPITIHGLGLSIGSASGMNQSYLDLLDIFGCFTDYLWHSEHLGFTDLRTPEGKYLHAGTQLPVPFTQEVIDLISARIQQLHARYQKTFLLENTTYYLPDLPNEGMDEVDFLNAITKQSDCGLILDLYNFYCNARNFNFDPYRALRKLDMSRVVEIHVAGGTTHRGMLLDVHSRAVPEDVWHLLEWVLYRAENVKAVLFELLEEAHAALGEEAILDQLYSLRRLWQKTAQVRLDETRERLRYGVA